MDQPGSGRSLTAGGALLARLKAVGVDVVFANSGTDFPPIIEGLAEAQAAGVALPQALVVPHEGAAMAMAHGYWLASGRPQAVMAHTNVGLANCAIGAINAAIEQVPVLLFSGRTPTTERGRFGARTVPIGWGQEMRDQAALVREAAKWDYELRFPEQVPELVDRARAIALSSPRGPVYLSLPREVLCQPCPAESPNGATLGAPPTMQPTRAAPEARALAEAAWILAEAERPVIFAQRGAGSPLDAERGFAALRELVEDWAIPVVNWWAVRLALATDHPMSAGFDPLPWLAEADAVLVLDSLAPWSPDIHRPRPDARIVQLAPDPLHARVPVRNFRADVALACETAEGVEALAAALAPLRAERAEAIEERRARVTARTAETRRKALAAAEAGAGTPMTKDWAARCLSDAIRGRHATVLSELGCPLAPMTLGAHDSWYQEPHAGGLGWSFPAGLGMALADRHDGRERLVVATMGDGSYLFANPVACHQLAEALQLPLLVLVLNNAEWGAVRHSVLGLYPEGAAAKANEMPLTSLAPSPDFVKVAEASRAWARRVEDGRELPAVLEEAIGAVEREGRLALVEVRVRP